MPLPLLWTALLLAAPAAASATAGAALEPGPAEPAAMQPAGMGVDPPVAIQARGRTQDKDKKRGSVGGLDEIRRAIKRGRKLPRYRDPLALGGRGKGKGKEEEESGEGAERAPARRESRVSDAQLASWYETCDANQNGASEPGEVQPLSVHRIVGLSVTPSGRVDGQWCAERGVLLEDGSARTSVDWIARPVQP